MNEQVYQMVKEFDELVSSLVVHYSVEVLAERAFILRPKSVNSQPDTPMLPLTILGLVHGVEVAGLAVLCQFLAKLQQGELILKDSLGIALGNVPAALKSVRFIERDLNRSFARDSNATAEDRRAGELEKLMLRSRFLLDFHQVKLPSASPFWIFPYHRAGFDLAQQLAGDVPIVTHWGKSFSQDGQCSDEFVIKSGASGVTLELGQNGFDPKQIARGLKVAITAVETLVNGRSPPAPVQGAKIFTWAEILPYPKTGVRVLDLGWSNFAFVKSGQRLGEFRGEVIASPVDGWLLFPKYPDVAASGVYSDTPPAAELVRILKEITPADLPQ